MRPCCLGAGFEEKEWSAGDVPACQGYISNVEIVRPTAMREGTPRAQEHSKILMLHGAPCFLNNKAGSRRRLRMPGNQVSREMGSNVK